jgi:hypothetical protein
MNDPLAEVKAFLGTGGANVNPNELTRDEATEELS